jgi:hypothetical protein
VSRKFDMSDYIPVAERIEAFFDKFPDGSLQSEIVRLDDSYVLMRGYAYRTADDERPGMGLSGLEIPGATPYTRGSEIENAETSAWGRATAALGFEVRRGVASAEEVRNKQPGSEGRGVPGSRTPADKRQVLAELAAEKHLGAAALEQYADLLGFEKGKRLNDKQLDKLIEAVRGHGTDQPLELPLDDPELPEIPA